MADICGVKFDGQKNAGLEIDRPSQDISDYICGDQVECCPDGWIFAVCIMTQTGRGKFSKHCLSFAQLNYTEFSQVMCFVQEKFCVK